MFFCLCIPVLLQLPLFLLNATGEKQRKPPLKIDQEKPQQNAAVFTCQAVQYFLEAPAALESSA